MSAQTEWTFIKNKKTWGPPMMSSGLRRADAEHPQIPSRTKEQFPTLGSAVQTAKPSALNFKTMATDATIRFAREEEEAAAAECRRIAEEARITSYYSSYEELAHRRFLANIPNRCYDDGPEDYDPPEDEGDDYSGVQHNYGYSGRDEENQENQENQEQQEQQDEENNEFNANLAVNRRAGDKSDW